MEMQLCSHFLVCAGLISSGTQYGSVRSTGIRGYGGGGHVESWQKNLLSCAIYVSAGTKKCVCVCVCLWGGGFSSERER